MPETIAVSMAFMNVTLVKTGLINMALMRRYVKRHLD